MTHSGRYVSYFRVSTGKQGQSGLGLEAQAATVKARLNGGDWSIVESFTEIESGRSSNRPELAKALAHCRVMGARLIVANVSRLTRDPDFMSTLVAANVDVEFCDLPKTEGPVGKFMLRQMLSVAELEAGMVSERTRKALAAAKARNVKLGGDRGNLSRDNVAGRVASLHARQAKASLRAADLSETIESLRAAGITSLGGIARALTESGIPTSRDMILRARQAKAGLAVTNECSTWAPSQVARILASL